jgi:hypothetical protein
MDRDRESSLSKKTQLHVRQAIAPDRRLKIDRRRVYRHGECSSLPMVSADRLTMGIQLKGASHGDRKFRQS